MAAHSGRLLSALPPVLNPEPRRARAARCPGARRARHEGERRGFRAGYLVLPGIAWQCQLPGTPPGTSVQPEAFRERGKVAFLLPDVFVRGTLEVFDLGLVSLVDLHGKRRSLWRKAVVAPLRLQREPKTGATHSAHTHEQKPHSTTPPKFQQCGAVFVPHKQGVRTSVSHRQSATRFTELAL